MLSYIQVHSMSTRLSKQHRISSLHFVCSALYPFRFYLVALVFILLVYGGNVFLKTQLIQMLVDAVVQASTTLDELWALVGHFGVVLLIELLTFRCQEWCTLRYEPVLQNHITTAVFKHVLQREYGFFQTQLVGNLTAKINDLAACIPALVAMVLYDYFISFLLVGVAFMSLWRVSHGLAWAISCWALLTVATALFITQRALHLAKYSAEAAAQIGGKMTDVFDNTLTARLFSMQAYMLRQMNLLQAGYVKANQKYRGLMLKFYVFQGASFQLYQMVCLLLLVHMYGQHRVSAGVFAMILSTNLIITSGLWKMFERMQELNTLWGKVSQAVQVLLAPTPIQDKPHATPLVVSAGIINFEQVTFGYSNTAHLFRRETLCLAAKQKVGLVGYSGSGKTTFVHLIARLFDVDSGAILIDGQDIRDVTQETLHAALTVVTQESNLFHSTILENIRCGKPDADDSDIIEAAKKACAHEFIMQLPHQYDTSVGARGLKLSGGQRQRIAIARAFLKDAPIVLLDEVTAHLDVVTEQKIHAELAAWVRDKTALVISHRLDNLKHMDRILVFDKGKIVENGTHHQLLVQGGHYTTLWNRRDRGQSYKRVTKLLSNDLDGTCDTISQKSG
jgi:ATP-binding cassette, subfamily B, bacterial